MLSRTWLRVPLTLVIGLALLSGGLALAGKPPRLSDPKNLAASDETETSITLTWESGGSELGFIIGYLEGALPDPKCANVTPIDVGTATSYVVTGLNPGTSYGFRVCAYDARKTSDGATLSAETLGGSSISYWLTLLDTFESSNAYCINSHGHVAGYASSPEKYGGDTFAFVFTPETGMVDLNELLPAGHDWHLRFANDINDTGQIVGSGYRGEDERRRAFRYTPALIPNEPGFIEELIPLSADDLEASATRINELGEVAVRVKDANGVSHVWLFADDLPLPVHVFSPTGGTSAAPVGINESGQILIDIVDTAVRVTVIGEPEYFYDVALCWDMNDNGYFAGLYYFEVPVNKKKTITRLRAMRHDGVTALDIGAGDDSVAYGINNNGDVVGRYGYDRMYRGWVYLEELGRVVDLDDVVVGDEADLLLWDAASSINYPRINNTGQIVGSIAVNNLANSVGFILTPVP